MDKILIITDFRAPKGGEKFIAFSAKKVETAQNDMASAGDPRYIVGAEIEVPENAARFVYHFRTSNREIPNEHGAIPLPRKTVKKWKWERPADSINGCACKIVTERHTQSAPSPCGGWRKVEGSEQEE